MGTYHRRLALVGLDDSCTVHVVLSVLGPHLGLRGGRECSFWDCRQHQVCPEDSRMMTKKGQ